MYGKILAYLRSPLIFFFNDTATTEIYTLSLHDALPISRGLSEYFSVSSFASLSCPSTSLSNPFRVARSEEHTSELQSQSNLVCRLLLEKKTVTLHYDRRFPSLRGPLEPAPPGF